MIPTLYRLMLRTQVTRGRVFALAAIGVVSLIIGLVFGQADLVNPTKGATEFINVFGLSLVVPVATLVFASAALGDLTEDGTLVYLWLRPVPRWQVIVAATLASFTITWPLVVIPLMLAALLAGGGGTLAVAVLSSATAIMIAYAALFVTLGLRVKRAFIWGLVYIFVWEGFVARANTSAARLAIRSYGSSILSDATGISLRLADFTVASSWAVPIAVALVAIAYGSWRLSTQDIP